MSRVFYITVKTSYWDNFARDYCMFIHTGSVAGLAGEEGEGLIKSTIIAVSIFFRFFTGGTKIFSFTITRIDTNPFKGTKELAELGDLVWGHFSHLSSIKWPVIISPEARTAPTRHPINNPSVNSFILVPFK